jgi:hypothetical protein
MSVLVLHRNPFEPFPYDRWLHDYDGEIVVVADRSRFAPFAEPVPSGNAGYAHLELFDHTDDESLVRERALKLAAHFRARFVVAHHEADVTSAAWLRDRLDLPGLRVADVRPFRDKALMKERLRAAGIEVARYTVPHGIREAQRFADEHGFPVVAKNRSGYSSIGLRILRDRNELDEHLVAVRHRLAAGELLLEAFVPGRMCHVDGLVVGGRTVLAWPSQYQYDLASFGTDPGPRVDVTLDPGDPLTGRLLALTEAALSTLHGPGGPRGNHGVHAEVFHTPDDRLVVCEVACRHAGAKVREVFAAMFGANLGEYATRAEVGLALPRLEEHRRAGTRPQPARMAGQALMMKRPGRVESLPAPPAEPWVERFWLYARPGQVLPPAGASADFLVAVVASGPTRTECERRLRELGARFAAQTRIASTP